MSVTFDPSGKNVTKMRMFIGPNNYKLLKRYDKDNKGQKLELNSLIYLVAFHKMGKPIFYDQSIRHSIKLGTEYGYSSFANDINSKRYCISSYL